MRLRPEVPADIPAIHDLTAAAFLHAPHTAHTEQFIVRALRQRGKLALSLLAEEAGVIVGHVAVSPVVLSDGGAGWFGLGPISVSPERQRQGIGSQLMRQVLEELRNMRAAGCVLVGDPHFYQRFGFAAHANLTFPGVPPEYFMACAFASTIPTATVAFDEAFWVKE